jgi:putative endonuclease
MNIFVYMLRCRDKSYYVGITRGGLDKRIAEHQAGHFPGYTSSRRLSNWSGQQISNG